MQGLCWLLMLLDARRIDVTTIGAEVRGQLLKDRTIQ